MARIAILHVGFGGHIAPGARLGAALSRQGHEVLAWAPGPYREQIAVEQVRFQEFDPLEPGVPVGSLPELAASLAEAADRCLGGVIDELHSAAIDLVMHDVHVPWGRLAADFLGLPRVVSNPLFPGSMRRWQATDESGGAGAVWSSMAGAAGSEALRRVEVARRSISRTWKLELGDWNYALSSFGGATVSYTTARIAGTAVTPAGWCYAGPLMTAAPPAAEHDRLRPLVYVAFGTYPNTPPELFRMAIDALADEPVQIVVSTGRSRVRPADLEPLPANVEVREFVASRELLSRASVHVTHAGCSSVHESLIAGVPMVCTPQASDQPWWAARVEALGAGIVVTPRPGDVRAATRLMLEDPSWSAHAQALGEELSRYDGEARLAALVEQQLAAAARAAAS
jgi:MGT family glycosyltransferase